MEGSPLGKSMTRMQHTEYGAAPYISVYLARSVGNFSKWNFNRRQNPPICNLTFHTNIILLQIMGFKNHFDFRCSYQKDHPHLVT